MKEIKTNLRWPGGKSKMTKILDNFLPKEVNKYLEVFTGGGSVLLHIIQKFHPETAYANDIDKNLIGYYEKHAYRDREQMGLYEMEESK